MSEELDPEQKVASEHNEGPMLLLAGAGSGKTKTIIERVKRIMNTKVANFDEILMLTFSRKAAREMYDRLFVALGANEMLLNDRMPTIINFHSFGWDFIQKHPLACGFKQNVTLITEASAKKRLRTLIKSIDDERLAENQNATTLEGIFGTYDRARSVCERVYEKLIDLGVDDPDDIRSYYKEIEGLFYNQQQMNQSISSIISVLKDYKRLKRRDNHADFGDMLLLPVIAMKENAALRDEMADKYRFVIVDEMQDTSKIQYDLIRLLAPHKNIFCVGDDDQCIYSWRNANPENMRMFLDEYQAKLIRLERNYRSTAAIVDRAAQLIANNKTRIPKTPYAFKPASADDPLPLMLVADNDRIMSEYIARDIREKIDSGVEPKDIAILYRTNQVGTLVEGALFQQNIPYRLAQGSELMKKKEVAWIHAACQLVYNDRDSEAFRTFAEMFPGIGDKTIEQITNYMYGRSDIGLFAIPREYDDKFTARVIDIVEDMGHRIADLKKYGPGFLYEWAKRKEMGFFGPRLIELDADKNQKAALKKYTKACIEAEEKGEEPPEKLRLTNNQSSKLASRMKNILAITEMFWHRLTELRVSEVKEPERAWMECLATFIGTPDDEADLDENKVNLMTVFRAKGLEYGHVYVPMFTNTFLPLVRNKKDAGLDVMDILETDEDEMGDEEERRLAYVAATRSKRNLTFIHANRVSLAYDTKSNLKISPYAKEMGLNPVRININSSANDFIEDDVETMFEMGLMSASGAEKERVARENKANREKSRQGHYAA